MVPSNIKKCSSEKNLKTALNHGSRMSILEDFAKNIDQVGFIWFTLTFCNISEGKWSLYILYFLIFIHILYLFIAQGKFCLVSQCIFFFDISSIFFGNSPKGLQIQCIFLGISSLWNWVKCSGCHNLLYFVSLFSYIIIFWLALIRHIRFCCCELF